MNTITKCLVAAALALAGLAAQAAAVTLAGKLDDAGNPYLHAYDMGFPLFDSDEDIANNVALYQVDVTQAGTLTLASGTYGAGGIDPYVTLFSGSDFSATFVASAQDDFTWSGAVTPGWYWVAIADWDNYSFAENLGTGVLGDGFIGIGQADLLGDRSYSVTVSLDTGSTPPIPEPSPAWLLGAGLAALAARSWRARRADRAPLSPSPASRTPRRAPPPLPAAACRP
jgi:hypothetical protein